MEWRPPASPANSLHSVDVQSSPSEQPPQQENSHYNNNHNNNNNHNDNNNNHNNSQNGNYVHPSSGTVVADGAGNAGVVNNNSIIMFGMDDQS